MVKIECNAISLKIRNKLMSREGNFVKIFPSFKSFREVKWSSTKWKEERIKLYKVLLNIRMFFWSRWEYVTIYRGCYMHVACTVFWLLLLITCNSRIVLIFMKPKGCYTSVVKDYTYRHWKENVPYKSFLLLKQSVTSIHCTPTLEGFWTNPLVLGPT